MLTHVNEKQQPTMVDVTDKNISARVAKAQTLVRLPEAMKDFLVGEEFIMKKGPVFQTAIIAGTMAVKKTHELIPFCHQIPVESCKFDIHLSEDLLVTITCEVKTTFKTGVEMEALYGASAAALTIYDMCKAISHEISILETKLLTKTGGKRTVLDRPTFGLVLTGGKSERMKKDKALIDYYGRPHARYIYDVLKPFCAEVYLSGKENQWDHTELSELKTIIDTEKISGPLNGMVSAFKKHPEANWIVVACDLVHFNDKTVETLLAHYDSRKTVAFKNLEKGFPEPLCALYPPSSQKLFINAVNDNITCPVKVLKSADVVLLEQTSGINLANINTPEERSEALYAIR